MALASVGTYTQVHIYNYTYLIKEGRKTVIHRRC